MRVDLQKQDGVVGTVALDRRGHAVASDEVAPLLRDVRVVEPGTLAELGPEDGERYLRALPATFRGAYFWATLVEDSGDARPVPERASTSSS